MGLRGREGGRGRGRGAGAKCTLTCTGGMHVSPCPPFPSRSLHYFARITAGAFAVVTVLYLATAIGGYVLFGSATKGDVLQNFAGACFTLEGKGTASLSWL